MIPKPTKQVQILNKALNERGIKTELEYWDGHKHVDIAVLEAGLFIEIDGLHHYTDPKQIEADLKRNHYSDGDDFETMHITNQLIDNKLESIVDALVKVIKKRIKK